jgi:hypothetical protein
MLDGFCEKERSEPLIFLHQVKEFFLERERRAARSWLCWLRDGTALLVCFLVSGNLVPVWADSYLTSSKPSGEQANLARIDIPIAVQILNKELKFRCPIELTHHLKVCVRNGFFGETGTPGGRVIGWDDDARIGCANGMDSGEQVFLFGSVVGIQANLAAAIHANRWRFPVVNESIVPRGFFAEHNMRNLVLNYPDIGKLVFNEDLLDIGNPSVGFNGVPDDGSNSNQFRERFPPWRMYINSLLGFFVGWWGWHNLRNDRRLFWGTLCFIFGIIIWSYAVYKFLEWSG